MAEKPTGVREGVTKAINDYSIQKDIAEFLYMIADNTLDKKSDKDAKNELIRKLFASGFEINDPSGTKKIGSKVIQQALWRVMSKVKFLNCAIHGTNKSDDVERLVTEGVKTVADRGSLASCFRDKCGVFMNSFLYGDGFLLVGKGENDENPVSFRVLRNEDVYVDNFAYGIRGVKPANKVAVIFQFSKDEAYDLWPELEEGEVFGRIPGTFQSTDRESDREDVDVVEVCWAWNKAKRKYVIFAGTKCYQIDNFQDEEYPFVKNGKPNKSNGKPFIPVFQFLCQPSEDGFLNYGIGEMVYDLAVITAKLLNMEVGHISENVYPITLINAAQSKVDELIEKLAMAEEARAVGGRPVVAMEFDAGSSQNNVAAQTLLTQNLFNEWSAVWDRLYKELSRLGINVDDIERGNGVTRGQVIAEEQASNAFILQMMEYNATETQELMECIIDAITEFVSDKNKTPLNLLTRITLPDGTAVKPDKEITMGMLSKELKDGNYFVVTDSRTGAIPSDLMKSLYLEKQLATVPPGTPEYNEYNRQLARIRGVEMPAAPPPQAPAPGPQGGNEVTPMPSETQRVLPGMTGKELMPV